jgi:hypothetical protein
MAGTRALRETTENSQPQELKPKHFQYKTGAVSTNSVSYNILIDLLTVPYKIILVIHL